MYARISLWISRAIYIRVHVFQAMLGDLPPDFLCIDGAGSQQQQQQLQSDAVIAQQLQANQAMFPTSTMARLNITVAQVHYIIMHARVGDTF